MCLDLAQPPWRVFVPRQPLGVLGNAKNGCTLYLVPGRSVLARVAEQATKQGAHNDNKTHRFRLITGSSH